MNKTAVRLFFTMGILFLIMISHSPLYAEAKKLKVKQSHEIVLGSLQIKEQYNLGMVFSGVQLEYRYGLLWELDKHKIRYQPKLGVGAAFNRGMLGVQIHFAPVNVMWTVSLYEKSGHTIKVGANFITDYNYHYYQLNDGTLFWTAEIGISPILRYGYQWNNKGINLTLQNSLLGFTSHRQGYDPYFWCFTWRDFVVNPNKNMKFGSFNHYNHTTVSLEFIPNVLRKHSIVYEFDYLGFYQGNRFHRINHNVIWRISL